MAGVRRYRRNARQWNEVVPGKFRRLYRLSHKVKPIDVKTRKKLMSGNFLEPGIGFFRAQRHYYYPHAYTVSIVPVYA